jgi:hypothetical protein
MTDQVQGGCLTVVATPDGWRVLGTEQGAAPGGLLRRPLVGASVRRLAGPGGGFPGGPFLVVP